LEKKELPFRKTIWFAQWKTAKERGAKGRKALKSPTVGKKTPDRPKRLHVGNRCLGERKAKEHPETQKKLRGSGRSSENKEAWPEQERNHICVRKNAWEMEKAKGVSDEGGG